MNFGKIPDQITQCAGAGRFPIWGRNVAIDNVQLAGIVLHLIRSYLWA